MPVLPHDPDEHRLAKDQRDSLHSRWPIRLRIQLGAQLDQERDDAHNRYFLDPGQARLAEATRQALGRPLGSDRRSG